MGPFFGLMGGALFTNNYQSCKPSPLLNHANQTIVTLKLGGVRVYPAVAAWGTCGKTGRRATHLELPLQVHLHHDLPDQLLEGLTGPKCLRVGPDRTSTCTTP